MKDVVFVSKKKSINNTKVFVSIPEAEVLLMTYHKKFLSTLCNTVYQFTKEATLEVATSQEAAVLNRFIEDKVGVFLYGETDVRNILGVWDIFSKYDSFLAAIENENYKHAFIVGIQYSDFVYTYEHYQSVKKKTAENEIPDPLNVEIFTNLKALMRNVAYLQTNLSTIHSVQNTINKIPAVSINLYRTVLLSAY